MRRRRDARGRFEPEVRVPVWIAALSLDIDRELVEDLVAVGLLQAETVRGQLFVSLVDMFQLLGRESARAMPVPTGAQGMARK